MQLRMQGVLRALAVGLMFGAVGMTHAGQESRKAPLRAGIIGCDTSHVIAFTKILNQDDNPAPLNSVRVVAAYPGGSPDLPSSADRVEGYTKQLKDEFGVEIVDSIPALLEKVDVVLLESVDGRPHLEQVRPVIAAGKPVFIDKPVAGSLKDTIAIFQLAEKAGVPCFSSSSLRYSPNILRFREGNDSEAGAVLGCMVFSPCALEEHHPDFFWYGIHGVESLFTIMGTGCTQVQRLQTPGAEVAVGLWNDGRIGTFRGLREGRADYGATVFGEKNIVQTKGYGGYEPLLVEICKFFQTGKPPVSAEETIELVAFMEAADESKRQGGVPVSIASVIEQARKELAETGPASDK